MAAEGGPASLEQVVNLVDASRRELGGKLDDLTKEIRDNNLVNSTRLTAFEVVQKDHTETLKVHGEDIEALKTAKAERAGSDRVKHALWGAAGALACGGGVTAVVAVVHMIH